MKPFDRKHDGFAIGEGAGILLIESLDSARNRGADIYAEIVGWSYGCDTYALTAHNPDGSAIVEQIRQALKMAKCTSAEIDYINAHGTATAQNDTAEARAIKHIFGKQSKDLNISSTKPVTGHLLGAAGSIEAIITALAIKHSIVPPTINFSHSDPEFSELNFTSKKCIEKKVNMAITMNFGFGGHIGILILAKYA